MERSRRHWKILQQVEQDFTDNVSEFLVIGDGDGVVMVTEPDGEGFWFGEMQFGNESKEATEPTRLGVRNLVRMAHGLEHIVLLDGMGMVYTLGENYCGQLGLGNVGGPHFTPQRIPASSRQFIQVRCGYRHSLALTHHGKVWAWGGNYYGQVGLPSSTSSALSTHQITVLDSHQVVAVECGGNHSLALTDQGQVYGWGWNNCGQLAQDSQSSLSTPVRLSCTSTVFTQIAAGHRHTLLLAEEGQVFACGLNDCGQLGLPTSTKSSSILCQVSGLIYISQIASHFARNLSIALSADRRCFVWGKWNQASFPTPIQLSPTYSTIESPLSFKSTRRNTPHSVRIKVPQFPLISYSGTQTEQFEISTLGQSSQHWEILQQVERNFMNKVSEFLVIGDGDGVVMITEPDGEGFWFGEMQFGTESKEATEPTRLGVRNLVRMAHGLDHIVLLDRMGMVYTLGKNYCGQLGLGAVTCTQFTPQLIPASSRQFIQVRCGYWHSLALTQDGKVWAWGGNYNGQVGLSDSTTSIPSLHQIDELDSHRVVSIECGAFHSLALTDQGQVYGWGCNNCGQLAQDCQSSISTPVPLACGRSVTQIAAGHRHTLLLAEDGQVFACGLNDCGQLGLPTSFESSSSLCQVSDLPSISQISSHFDTDLSIALSTDRRCFVWGYWNQASFHAPLQLLSTYSTIESPLSSKSTRRNTPHSVRIKD